MPVKEIIDLLPTADRLLELTEDELQRVLLGFLAAAAKDPSRHFGATCEGTITELFGSHGGYNMSRRDPVQRAIRRAWRALEKAELIEEPDSVNGKNGYRVISEKGRAVKTDVDFKAAKVRGWLAPELLHPELRGAALRAFAAGDYDTAVFEAFKAVEIAVRKKGRFPSTDFGVALMRKAFDPTSGPLRDTTAKPSRREARQNLFMGAMGELRNPKAHDDPTITDPQMAIEELMTASLLLRIIS